MGAEIRLEIDGAEFLGALSRLAELAEHFPELIQPLIECAELRSQILRVVPSDYSTLGAGYLRVRFEPSDFLREFMAAIDALEPK
jgi:hypothetical protein